MYDCQWTLCPSDMRAIYKYPLPAKERLVIELPLNAQIIRVGDVDGLFFLWAIVNTDPECPKQVRHLEFYKTGQPIETPLEHLHYLGECKLFIMQELCLYTFENVYKLLRTTPETDQADSDTMSRDDVLSVSADKTD